MRRLALALALALAWVSPAAAYFELTSVGAREIALGPSSMAVVDDASAYHWNPAALATLAGPEVMVDYSKPYGVENLSENALVLGGRRWNTGWSAAWHRTSVADIYAEDQFCLAAGRRLSRTPDGSQFDVGATFVFGRASFQPFDLAGVGTLDYGTVSKGSLDAGARWRTPWNADIAWVAHDLLQPRYEFVAGSGGDRRTVRQEAAVALRWNRESTLSFGWRQAARGPSLLSAGMEIRFFDVFAIRSGLTNLASTYEADSPPTDLEFTGGFGIFHRGVQIDAAAETSRDLGASYRVSLRFRPGHREER